jgi:hypothetical protein
MQFATDQSSQALRRIKMMSAMTRMVPRMPPPIYMELSVDPWVEMNLIRA